MHVLICHSGAIALPVSNPFLRFPEAGEVSLVDLGPDGLALVLSVVLGGEGTDSVGGELGFLAGVWPDGWSGSVGGIRAAGGLHRPVHPYGYCG